MNFKIFILHSFKYKIFNPKFALFFLSFFALFTFCFVVFSFKENNLINENYSQENTISPVYSQSSSEILVPNLVEKNFKDLQKEYQKNQEFKICILKKELNNHLDKDLVISQIPEKGAFVKRGSTIAVTLSLGSSKKQLPKINGDNLSEAANKLSKLGFIPKLTKMYSDNVENKLIIGYENFNEGDFLDYNSEVNIVQSLGPID